MLFVGLFAFFLFFLGGGERVYYEGTLVHVAPVWGWIRMQEQACRAVCASHVLCGCVEITTSAIDVASGASRYQAGGFPQSFIEPGSCMRIRSFIHSYIHHSYTYIYRYIPLFIDRHRRVCVCVCVYAYVYTYLERERESERAS